MFEVFSELDQPTIEVPWDYLPWGEEFAADTVSVFGAEDGAVLVSWRLRFDERARYLEDFAGELAALNPGLRVGFEGQDIWMIAAERAELLEQLPEELSWAAAPESDFGHDKSTSESKRRPILCPRRERLSPPAIP